jgi:hypothetical protein
MTVTVRNTQHVCHLGTDQTCPDVVHPVPLQLANLGMQVQAAQYAQQAHLLQEV